MGETYQGLNLFLDFCVIATLILGIWLFRWPQRAALGNLTAALALAGGAGLVLFRNGIYHPLPVTAALVAGSGAGYWVARRITMTQIPAMVAFQHGAGGVAAFCLSLAELLRGGGQLGMINEVSGLLGLAVGAVTFSASMVAGGKLSGTLVQTPKILPRHTRLVMVNFVAIAVFVVVALYGAGAWQKIFYAAIILLSILLGVVFSIRIGGADMPVLISFLNATAGVAAAFCGMIIENKLLISCGATVAASGSILTHVMCRAMNRRLFRIFIPAQGSRSDSLPRPQAEPLPESRAEPGAAFAAMAVGGSPVSGMASPAGADPVPAQAGLEDRLDKALKALLSAGKIIVIPGYGMALAQAQFKVIELASMLEGMGKSVRFAIHPVAGRMPGHMNVLLAEAEVDYDNLFEMDEINPEFSQTDVVLVVGACDVVNPMAMAVEGTPISGMPILMAQDARQLIICNFDEKPGYSGVENSLYQNPGTIMLLGDAAATVSDLINGLKSVG
jgi:NAD(P) transhydrogenase subunit beta